MSAAGGVCDLVYGFAEEQDFQQVLDVCRGAFNGLDYLPVSFHRWLCEPGRLVFIARMKDRVVGLESALLVDGGQTAVFQGLRVASDLRGRGIAGGLQRHITDYIRHHYPEVSAVRTARVDLPSPQSLTKYRLIAKEAIMSLCCEAADLSLFVTELRSRLSSQSDSAFLSPVTLNQQQAETLILSDHMVSKLLPNKTLINNWEPLKPVEANLEVLRRRELKWIVDRESKPSAVSLRTAPYSIPYRHDAMLLNIDIYGHDLSAVCAVFLAQLEASLPSARGYLIIYTYMDPEIWPGLHETCKNNSKVSFYSGYFEQVILESDL
ncbi:histidine N-acetyltransferase-like [Notolabrus celidotus]|uniref:histidine N-acetyltransferase-like n=1 Tax=Notolabrus celidotus TaxID=1203425 RepID=UPI00148F6BEC|nr:histidine N-acetyltransferase-like [Notolabrus celidotus]